MPKRKLDNWIESYLALTENTEPPRMFREWIAVSVLASVLKRKCFTFWGDITFYPNMYIVLVGPSGKCRKGTAMTTGVWFLRQMGVTLAAEAITREALIQELAGTQDIAVIDGKQVLHASLTIYSQELTVFLGYNNLQLLSDITDWYDCRDPWIYRTKGSGTDTIAGVWVNLIGATTPSLVREALPRDAIGGGLSSRIIFVYEEDRDKDIPFPFYTEEQKKLRQTLLEDLAEISTLNGGFKVAENFMDPYMTWYLHQAKNPRFVDPNFDGYVQRRPNHVMKLCMILSAAQREDMVITGDIFQQAVNLLERTEINMPKVFSGYGSSPYAEVMHRIMGYIATVGETTEGDLLRTFYSDITDQRQLHAMLTVMKQMAFISLTASPKGYLIKVNPNFKA